MRNDQTSMSGAQPAFVLMRAGKYLRTGREVEVSESDLDQAVENFDADIAAGVERPLDYDHSFSAGLGSRASGWLRRLYRRGADLMAEVEWTPAAREAIARGEYRYASAEFDPDYTTESGISRGFTIVAAALTNRPFLRGLGAVTFSEEQVAAAEPYLAEVERLIASGAYDPESCAQQVRAARLMAERGLTYSEAVSAAWKETR